MSVKSAIDRIKQNIANVYAVLTALGADLPDEQNSDNLATTAGTAKVLLYIKQVLTDAQKGQARENIGAGTSNFSGNYGDLNNIPSSFTPSAHGHDWDDVSGKPSAYPPESHSHSEYAPTSHTHTEYAASSHNQAADTITAGTFAGQVAANSSAQTPDTSLLRNSRLVSADTAPTVNGEICWKYE